MGLRRYPDEHRDIGDNLLNQIIKNLKLLTKMNKRQQEFRERYKELRRYAMILYRERCAAREKEFNRNFYKDYKDAIRHPNYTVE